MVHTHRFGVSEYTVRSNKYPNQFNVIEKCEIDFEPDRGETITIIAVADEEDIIDLDTEKEN